MEHGVPASVDSANSSRREFLVDLDELPIRRRDSGESMFGGGADRRDVVFTIHVRVEAGHISVATVAFWLSDSYTCRGRTSICVLSKLSCRVLPKLTCLAADFKS